MNQGQSQSQSGAFMAGIRNWFSEMPLVTRWIIFLNIALYLIGLIFGQDDGAYCLWPAAVMANPIEVYRIMTSAFLHIGILHIGFNMMAFAPMGSSLERLVGSLAFVHLIVVFVILAGLVDLLLSVLAALVGYDDWFGACGIGFSGVLFGLIVLETAISPRSHQSIFGLFRVPKALYPWALLFILQVVMPGISFIGHLSGMLVGYMHTFGFLKWCALADGCISRVEMSRMFDWIAHRHGYVTNPRHANIGGAQPARDRGGSGEGDPDPDGGATAGLRGRWERVIAWFRGARGWQEPGSTLTGTQGTEMEEGRAAGIPMSATAKPKPMFGGAGHRLGTSSGAAAGTGGSGRTETQAQAQAKAQTRMQPQPPLRTNAEIRCHDELVSMGVPEDRAWQAAVQGMGDTAAAVEWLENTEE